LANHKKYIVQEGETFHIATELKWGKKWFLIVSDLTGIILERTRKFRQAEGILQELKYAKRSNLGNARQMLELQSRIGK